MKKHVCCFLLLLTVGFLVFGEFFSISAPVSAVNTSTSSSVNDDSTLPPIIPPNTNYTVIDETVDIEQDVEIQSNATLFLKNAKLNVKKYSVKITFNNSRLQAINLTLASPYYFDIRFYGNSSAFANKLTIRKRGRLHVYDSSELTILTLEIKEGSVAAYDSSTVSISSGDIDGSVAAYDSSTVSISSGDRVGRVAAYDSSTVSISHIDVIPKLEVRNSSVVSISHSSIMENLYAFDSSTVALSSVTIKYKSSLGVESGLNSYGSSRVTISKSKVEWLRVFDSSTVSMFDTTLKKNGMRCYDSSVVFISNAMIEGINCITYDFSFITIVNSLIGIDLQGRATSLEAYNSSKVWVLSTTVKGSLSARGSSDLRIENSKEVWLLSASDSSVVSVRNSNVTLLRAHDSSAMSIFMSSTTLLRAYDSSSVYVSGSTVEELFIYCCSVNGSIADLASGSFEKWNFWLDSSVVIGAGGYAPDVTLEKTRIQQGWRFLLFGSSNVTITDSTVEYLGLSNSSVVRLISSTVGMEPHIVSEAKVHVYWYLDVYTVSGANVTVLNADGTVADCRWNVTDGFARFILIERMMNVSGTYSLGSYIVNTTSNGYSDKQSVEILGNQIVTATPPIPFWQQYWYVIIALVAVVATLVVVSFVIRKRRST